MGVLREIDAETGLRARRAEARTLLGIDPAMPSPEWLTLFGARFRVADEPGFTTVCDRTDLDEISQRVGEARRRADLVMVSVHSHEPGPTPETPGEFLRAFAHRMIDEGADIVVGHGPHFLRGVELYRNKPIFYSLGNIVSQIELADRIPAEDYGKVAARGPLTPGRYFDELSGHGRRLFAPHRRYWESLVPVLTFDDGALVGARLHPIELGFAQPVHRRGRPRLAGPADAKEILTDFARLAAPHGATVTVGDTGTGELVIDGSGHLPHGCAAPGGRSTGGGGCRTPSVGTGPAGPAPSRCGAARAPFPLQVAHRSRTATPTAPRSPATGDAHHPSHSSSTAHGSQIC